MEFESDTYILLIFEVSYFWSEVIFSKLLEKVLD